MRNRIDIISLILSGRANYLSVDHCVMVVQMKVTVRTCRGPWLDALTHLEEWVHLLLASNLVSKDAIVAHTVWLVDV